MRDPADPHAILAIRRDRDVEHRVVEPGIIGEAGPHRGVFRKLDNPVMLLAEHEFAHRAHHAVGFDTADRRFLEHHVAARHIGPRPAEHPDHAGAGIGRAAHHLKRRAVAGVDGQHLQLVGLRMALGGEHLRDLERGQRLGRIVDPLDLEPDAVERVGHRARVGVGIEMRLQPRQRELHAPTPPLSVGTSSAEKP